MAIKFLNSVNADSGVLYVDAANNKVGIGTASPETLLQVNGAVYSMIGMYSDHTYSSNRNWRIVTNSFGAGNWGGLAIKTSDTAGGTPNTTRFGIDYLGNVGIGTTSPNALLEISRGDSGQTTAVAGGDNLILSDSSNGGMSIFTPSTALGSIFFGDESDSDVGWIRYNHTNDYMLIGTGGGTRVTIKNNGLINLGAYGAGYLKSDASGNITVDSDTIEDTLDTVADRGNTTNQSLTARSFIANTLSSTDAGLRIQRYNSSGRAQFTLEDENGSEIWRVGATGGGTTNFSFYDQTQNALTLEQNGNVLITPNGNVGIGTTSPTGKLHIANTSGDANIVLAGSSGQVLSIDQNSIRTTTASQIAIFTNSTTTNGLYINSAGNIGVGTTSPTEKLHVSGNIKSNHVYAETYRSSRTDGDIYIQAASSSDFVSIGTEGGNNNLLTVLGSGNVGIGTASPSEKLHVSGDVRIEGDLTVNGSYTQIDTDVNTTEQWNVTNDGTGPAVTINQTGSQDIMDVQDDGTSVFYIEDGGNVGIGTTDPTSKLHVNIPGNTVAFRASRNGGTDGDLEISFGSALTAYNSKASGHRWLESGSEKMRLTGGKLGIGTTSPQEELEVKSASFTTVAVNTDRNSAGENIGSFAFYGKNNAATPENLLYSRIMGSMDSVTDGSESGDIYFQQINSGTIHETFRTNADGKLKLSQYGSNSFTGTAAYALAVDSSGNVIETTVQSSPAGIDGTGTVGYLTKWSTTDTITDSVIFESSGNIGIGTASPDYPLTVYNASGAVLKLDSGGANNSQVRFHQAGTLKGAITYIPANDQIRIYNEGDVVTIGTSNVGIGTTSPESALQVVGTVPSSPTTDGVHIGQTSDGNYGVIQMVGVTGGYIDFSASGNDRDGRILYQNSTNAMQFQTGSTTRMIISGGNVGIGTSSPSEKLHVDGGMILVGTDSGDAFNASALVGIQGTNAAYFQAKSSTTGFAGLLLGDTDDDYHAGMIYANDTSILTFNAGNSTRLAIDGTSGNVGIGTTSPSDKLDVSGQITQIGSGDYHWVTGTARFSEGGVTLSRGGTGYVGAYPYKNIDSFTASVAFKTTDATHLGIGFRADDSDADDNNYAVIVRNNSPTGTEVRVQKRVAASQTYPVSAVNVTTDCDDGEWHTLTVSFNGSHIIVYVDNTKYIDEAWTDTSFNDPGLVGLVIYDGTTVFSDFSVIETKALLTELDDRYVNVTGDTMSGDLNFEDSNGNTRLTIGNIIGSPYEATINTSNYHLVLQAKGTGQGQIRFNTGTTTATEKMRILENGNVGIGTTSPSRTLDVRGDAQILSTSSTGLRIVGGTTSEVYMIFGDADDNSMGGFAYNNNTNELSIDVNNSEAIRIDSSGNVGIGTTNPDHKLHVKQNSNSATGIRIENSLDNNGTDDSDAAAEIFFQVASNNGHLRVHGSPTDVASEHQIDLGSTASGSFLTFSPSGSEKVRIDSSGKVGIGTTSPDDKLSVIGDAGLYGTVSGGIVTPASLKFFTSENNAGLGDSTDANKQNIGQITWTGKDGSQNTVGEYAAIRTYVIDSNNLIQGSAGEGGQIELSTFRHDVATEARVEKLALTISPLGLLSFPQYGAGYLKTDANGLVSVDTSTIEDTLDSVTDRGNTTTNDIEVGNITTKNDSGIYSFSDTVNADSSEDIFSISNQHGSQAFRVTFVCSTSAYSVAKTFEVVHSYGNAPIFFKVVDTGAYGTHDFDVSFTNGATDDSKVVCSITNNSTTVNANIVSTVFLGGSPTAITVTAL